MHANCHHVFALIFLTNIFLHHRDSSGPNLTKQNYRFLQAVRAACPHGLLRGHSRSGHGLLQPRLLLGLRAAAVHVRLWIGKRVPPLSPDGDRRRRGRDEKAAGGHSQKHTFSKLPLLAVNLATAPGDSQGVVGMDHDLAMIEVVDWSPFL